MGRGKKKHKKQHFTVSAYIHLEKQFEAQFVDKSFVYLKLKTVC